MLKRIQKISAVLFVVLTAISCGSNKNLSGEPTQRGELTLALDMEIPGYFELNGENFGFQHDLLRAYADYLGVELNVVLEGSDSQRRKMLRRNEIDMYATLGSGSVSDDNISVPIYSTSYVVLARKGKKPQQLADKNGSIIKNLSGSTIMISSGFKSSRSYGMLLDSLPDCDIYLSGRNSFELIEQLCNGTYDYLVCEQSEAQLGCALVKNIRTVHHFEPDVDVSVVFRADSRAVAQTFPLWLEWYRSGEEFTALETLYFDRGLSAHLFSRQVKRPKGGISSYDELIRKVSSGSGYDWRFISAIAYQESKFNPYIVSNKGARGLMQIMPVVAREFKVDQSELMNPEVNVALATKLLRKIERQLRLPKDVPALDRMSLILASYNAGPGHVIDARNLAAKYNEDPDSWEVVAKYLRLKSEEQYSDDEVVRCGRFRGPSETLGFVESVMGKYDTYCQIVGRW